MNHDSWSCVTFKECKNLQEQEGYLRRTLKKAGIQGHTSGTSKHLQEPSNIFDFGMKLLYFSLSCIYFTFIIWFCIKFNNLYFRLSSQSSRSLQPIMFFDALDCVSGKKDPFLLLEPSCTLVHPVFFDCFCPILCFYLPCFHAKIFAQNTLSLSLLAI